MKKIFIKKIFALIFVVFGISILSFVLIRMSHGNPVNNILGFNGAERSKEAIQFLEKELGLDSPIYIQYLNWIKNIMRLDFGTSYFSGKSVLSEIISRIPNTLILSIITLVFSMILSIPLGYYISIHNNKLSKALKFFVIILGCMPSFWISLLLLYIISVKFNLLPVIYTTGIKGIILPTIVLSLQLIPAYILILENSFSIVIKKEYIFTAQIKGVKSNIIFLKHIFRNAMIPAITLIGHNFVSLLAGSFIIESIYGYPGIGKFIIDSILKKDYPVIQGYLIIFVVIVVIINIIVDFIYYLVDPTFRRDYEIK
ncbi:ABC transporter permease [Oceanivirga salmonicida]|uniref:ABC transporter permease n=1 Tax=Oceanivirga salmonicida TaxID=1769291 RepID=UPI000835A61B|nr:ABC transporter permease [Oceanivirga salmonicida]